MTAAPPPGVHDDVAAVVVHYRCLDATRTCLASLRRTAPGLRVYVVDNASADGSAEHLRGEPGAVLVESPRNGGFGAGCNLGIERALADAPSLRHVLLVNPDTTHRDGFVDALVACAARHPDAGIVGGLILEAGTSRAWFEQGAYRPWTLAGSHVAAPAGRDEYEAPFVTGCLMLLDAALLRDGLRFDEGYFLYVEDLDLCREVVRRGRSLWITRTAVIEHDAGTTQRGSPVAIGGLRDTQLYWITRNKVRFARKRLPLPQRCCALLVATLLRPVVGVLRYGRIGFLRTYFRAVRDGFASKV